MNIKSWVVLAGFMSLIAAIFYSPLSWPLKFMGLALVFFWISEVIEEELDQCTSQTREEANKKMAQLIAQELHKLEEQKK